MKLIFVSLVMVFLLLGGCAIFGEEPVEENETEAPPPPPPVRTPSFSIVSPSEGETVFVLEDSGDVLLSLSSQNLVLKQPGGAAKKGEGHFRVRIDDGPEITVTTKSFVLNGVAAGSHVLEVELINNDGSSYSPSIKRTVSFVVEKQKPAEYVPENYVVTIKDFSYDPAEITVKVKDSITFVNKGSFPRSATCFIDGKQVFDTKILSSGQNATITFDKIMECEYYSTTYKLMTGKVIVESNGVDEE